MGKSPLHAKNIALVLDRKTGYVSPQFHVVFDEHFTTAKDFSTGSDWQLKTGLFQQESTNVLQNQRENTPKKSVGKEPATPLAEITKMKPLEESTKDKPKETVKFKLKPNSFSNNKRTNNVNKDSISKRRKTLQSHESSQPCRKINVR